MADHDIEREESKGASKERDRRLQRSIFREWQASGYTRRQHLVGVVAPLETAAMLINWRDVEAMGTRTQHEAARFSCYCASQDIWELEQAIRATNQPPRQPLSRG